jgi:hypothetical protein
MTSKEDHEGQFGIRVACAYVPAVVMAHLADNWLPKPLAWVTSTFIWLLLAYWLPPRSRMRFGRWLIIVSALSFLIWLLVKLQPDMF